MNIVVTGCTGFLGGAIANSLSGEGHKVCCLSRSEHHVRNSHHVTCDLSKSLPKDLLPNNVDCIIHAAAVMDREVPPVEMFRVNTLALVNLLEYARGAMVSNFIFFSSGAVYGYSKDALKEDHPLDPIGFYGVTKKAAEVLVDHYAQYFSTKTLRLFFPYGEGQLRGIVPKLFHALLTESEITVVNGGQPVINPVHVDDIIELVKLLLSDSSHRLLNVCGEEKLSILELAQLIAEAAGCVARFSEQRDEGVLDLVADSEQANQVMGWRALTSLQEGIYDYVRQEQRRRVQDNKFQS